MTTNQVVERRPTVAFVLSLIAGLLILVGSGTTMMMILPLGGPHYGGMMGGYYGGMMDGYYGMMQGNGFGGWFYGLAALGVVSGIVVLIGAIMLYNQPTKGSTWGALILASSIVSLFGMGGFFIGAILGVAGGVFALTWKK